MFVAVVVNDVKLVTQHYVVTYDKFKNYADILQIGFNRLQLIYNNIFRYNIKYLYFNNELKPFEQG